MRLVFGFIVGVVATSVMFARANPEAAAAIADSIRAKRNDA